MSIISKSVINLATKTVTNLINSNPSSRRTTVGEIVAAMNASDKLDGETVTPEFVKHLVVSGSLNSVGVQEFELQRGRYGGVRQVDFEKRDAKEKAAITKAHRQEAAKKAREAKAAKKLATFLSEPTA